MNNVVEFETALALALKLAPKERLQLIERVAASVERDIDNPSGDDETDGETWGQKLVRMMEEGGPIDMIHPEIEDATEWVKQIRRDQDERRGLDYAVEGNAALSEREQVRARLDAAGLLAHHPIPSGIAPLTPEERLRIGTLKPGALVAGTDRRRPR